MKSPTDNFVPREYPLGNITQFFGENPKLYAHLGLNGHNGIDCVAPWDSMLYAVEDGTIIGVKREEGGFGRHVRLLGKSKNGVCNQWTYGHCERLLVEVGQTVKAGEPIATMGNTGFVVSTQYANTFWGNSPKVNTHAGTHLHLGVRKVVRDPKGFAYEGSKIKIRVLNYENGFKGSVDPLPLFTDENPKEAVQLKTISLLQKIVELYKLLLQTK